MAENPIRKEDIIDGAGITQSLKEIIGLLQNDLTTALKEVTSAAQQYKGAMSGVNAATKEGQAIIQTTTEETQKLNIEKAKIAAVQRELEKTERAVLRIQREEQEVMKTSEGSYKRLAFELKKLTAQWKEGDAATRTKLTPSIKRLDDELKKLDATIGKHQRNVGNYNSAWKGVGKTLLSAAGVAGGAVMAFRTLFRVISAGFKTTWDFEQQMSQVKAVSGATADEFDRLRESAISLGGSTKFTASEVAGLQTEYAKLGFTASQILQITSATLDLAAATGEDLAKSANIAGATLRGFGLDASKMQMVVDVMAESFNKSALDLESFSVAMQQIAPVANAVGQTIQQATAKLSVLSNAGLDASIAGTSLRNIFMELEAKGMTWDQAMDKLNNTSNKATMALELFGKRGAVAGIILSENRDEADKFTESFNNAAGAAEEMAGIMEENVRGSITKLKSAWEGFILRTNNSSGAVKGFIDVLTDMVSAINTKGKPAIDSMFETRKIENFGDKWKFYSQQGVGFWNTLTLSIFRGKKATQEYSDAMSSVYEEEMRKENEVLAEKERIENAKRKQHEEELKRLDAQVKAAEEAAKIKKEQDKIGQERVAKYWEGQLQIAEKATKDNNAILWQGYEEEYKLQLAQVDKQVVTEEEKERKLTEIKKKYSYQRMQLSIKETGEILQIVADGLNSMGEIYEAQKQRELSAAGDNAKKREEIERKYFQKQKALSIANTLVNGAVAVTRQFADLPYVAALITSALITATTIAQVSMIASQKFAKGGFTGKGGQRDETGERVAGIVHENEFVIDKKKTKKYRPLLDAIHRDDSLAVASELNNSNLVWARTADFINKQDPYTEKMYQLMKDTPVPYVDSNGSTVLVYPGGRKRVIKRPQSLHYSPSMIR